MTPNARVAAAIEILDRILAGTPAEKGLTNWARGSRFAGSKDRAAIRDHVFDALRRRRSLAALGGADTGRGLMLGLIRAAGQDQAVVFSGEGHAPPPLSEDEARAGRDPLKGAEALDCPDWLWPTLCDDLGDDLSDVLEVLRHVAPVSIRANAARIGRDALAALLAQQGINSHGDPRAPCGLVLEGRPRGLTGLSAWQDGLFELQDVGSQWISDRIPLTDGQTLLDFCAGGGGKSLAVAARVKGEFLAHDADFGRMNDLPKRAERAGVSVRLCRPGTALPVCDTVVADVPCSGTGTWRRTPDAKWRFSRVALDRLVALQHSILTRAAGHVRSGGYLVHATCSVLKQENERQVQAFLSDMPEFDLVDQARLLPDGSSDGYFTAIMRKR